MGFCQVEVPGGKRVAVKDAFWVLDTFADYRTPRDVSDEAAAKSASANAWIATMQSIQTMAACGALLSQDNPPVRDQQLGFTTESEHISMLDDRTRTQAFIDALRETVRPTDVVLDIGTGTGVLAMAAAAAGARHVYAVEQSTFANTARGGVRANNMEDKVTVIHGSSENITLPERADVVVAEIVGDDLFDEGILATLADAHKRLASPSARYIPSHLVPVVQPLKIPNKTVAKHLFEGEATRRWSTDYGLDFSWLLDAELRPESIQWEMRPSRLAGAARGEPLALDPVVFPDTGHMYHSQVAWPGIDGVNAMSLGFLAELSKGITLTNVPGQCSQDSSWGIPVFVPVSAGNRVLHAPGQVTVRYAPNRQTAVEFSAAVTTPG